MIAEMRSRGIPRNVHTFSALMNVCIKVCALSLLSFVPGMLACTT